MIWSELRTFREQAPVVSIRLHCKIPTVKTKIIFSYKPARHKRRQTLPDLLWLWFFEMIILNTCIWRRLNMREIFSDVKHQSIYQWTVVFLHKFLSCQLLINQRGKCAHKSVVTCMKNTSNCDLQMNWIRDSMSELPKHFQITQSYGITLFSCRLQTNIDMEFIFKLCF